MPRVFLKVHARIRLRQLRDDIVMERFCTLVGICVGSVLAPRGRAAQVAYPNGWAIVAECALAVPSEVE